MNIIDIEPTNRTPEIILNDEDLFFEMTGDCRPENIWEFYKPVIGKLKNFLDDFLKSKSINAEKDVFKVSFRLGYFNSASAKFIVDILLLIGDFTKLGCKIKVYWYFQEGDEDMLEAGEDFAEMAGIPIQLIMISKQ
ncbi:MAG: DUF1987 domain-containing protein [Bacteroidales bacterium]|nr:DUF1987 domain-containing protein [Bacteroidales bacterium]